MRFIEPDGGYFLWVELPEDIDTTVLEPVAAEHGVAVVKGSDFLSRGAPTHSGSPIPRLPRIRSKKGCGDWRRPLRSYGPKRNRTVIVGCYPGDRSMDQNPARRNFLQRH